MNGTSLKTRLVWQVGWTDFLEQVPERFVEAVVPGAVQLDWGRAEGWPPYWEGENFRAYGWMEDKYWVYRAVLPKNQLSDGERLFLRCKGVDYACLVRVNSCEVLRHEGMFSEVSVELTEYREGSILEIVVFPAPKDPVSPSEQDIMEAGRKESRQSCKPAVSYGWDFHPRLIPLGLWDEVVLERVVRGGSLDPVEVTYELSADFTRADLKLSSEGAVAKVRWTVRDPEGRELARQTGPWSELRVVIPAPSLWWPNTEGQQALYFSTIEVLGGDEAPVNCWTQRLGFRKIRLVMAPGQFDRAGGLPATQPPVPITFEVNGRRIFARGANWVCPEIFPGLLTRERYREQLELFAGAHLNLLRSWGGAVVNKPDFFDLCDELGILVWQEFPLACNRYEGTEKYLKVLDQEARAVIRRLRRHASLALWCGGNELYNSWSGMTMQDAALRLLGHHCFELDPDRPFLPTSPLAGIKHGDYRFVMGREEAAPTVFDVYPAQEATAYMEFGVPGPPSVKTLRRILPAKEWWPVTDSGSWRAHHAFNAWHSGEPGSWLYPEVSYKYFGSSEDLRQLVGRLQLLQAEGYKAVYEEGRRQKPVCSAVACWVFNEPWPTAANNSLIAWPNEPKPAYEAVKASNRPTMLSARIPCFDWAPGASFTTELFLLNDAPVPTEPVEVGAYLEDVDGVKSPLGRWSCPGGAAGVHVSGPMLSAPVPLRNGETFRLVLVAQGRPEWDSVYTLVFKRPN